MCVDAAGGDVGSLCVDGFLGMWFGEEAVGGEEGDLAVGDGDVEGSGVGGGDEGAVGDEEVEFHGCCEWVWVDGLRY